LAQLLLYHPIPSLPTDYSRIRLITVLLETSIPYLMPKGKNPRKKTSVLLTTLIHYFFLYVHYKQRPLPLDLDYKVTDALAAVREGLAGKGEVPVSSILPFPPTRAAAEEGLGRAVKELEKGANAGFAAEAWLLHLIECLSRGDRIYSVAQKMAPVGLDVEEKGSGSRAQPVEGTGARGDGSDTDSGSDGSDSDSDDSDSGDSSGSDSGSSDTDGSSDEEEEEEEEEEEDLFSRGAFTRGGDWGAIRGQASTKGQTEEDKEFNEMLLELKREAAKGARVALKQSIDRAMEDKLPSNLTPYARVAPRATAESAASEDSAVSLRAFGVLRRGANDRVEAKPLLVPSESEFAQKTASTQSAEEKARAENAAKVAAMAKSQREQEERERVALLQASRFGGRGGRGRW
jgi:hypothetical protein